MRNILSLLALAGALSIAGMAPAFSADDTRASSAPASPSSGAGGSDAGNGGSAGGNGAAMQGGGAGSGNPTSGVPTLQDALRECEGLSGALSARCQEQALADHPGEF